MTTANSSRYQRLQLAVVSGWASVLSLVLTGITLAKVRGIARARTLERQLFRDSLDIQGIEEVLTEAAGLLQDIGSANRGNGFGERIQILHEELLSRLGQMSGVYRVLAKYAGEADQPRALELVDDYYSTAFTSEQVQKARRIIRVICIRTMRMTEPDVLDALRERIERGCKFEMLALSPDAPEEVVEYASGILPIPTPEGADDFAQDIIQGRANIARFRQTLKRNEHLYRYYEFKHLPNIHFMQSDNDIYLGFQYCTLLTQECPLRTMGLKIPARSRLGKAVLDQFQYLKNLPDTVEISATQGRPRTAGRQPTGGGTS